METAGPSRDFPAQDRPEAAAAAAASAAVSGPPGPPGSSAPLEGGLTGHWMTRRYVLALSIIALLASSAFLAFSQLLAQHEDLLAIVNISGRQRMLSQRTALYVELLATRVCHTGDPSCRQHLAEATAQLEENFERLSQQGSPAGFSRQAAARIHELYFDPEIGLQPLMRRYLAALHTILQTPAIELTPSTPEVELVVRTAPNALLPLLDEIVTAYQEGGEEVFALLQRFETAVLLLTLGTILLEALLVFRPMVRQVMHQFRQNASLLAALSRARETLEQQVSSRTAELAQAKAEAEAANLAKSRFLAAASHDLRQPLEVMRMLTAVLERRNAGDEKTQAILVDLKAAQGSMQRLLQTILDISKLEAGFVTPRPAVFSVAALLGRLERAFRPLTAEKGLELRHVSSSVFICSDYDLLERIISNFLSNAVRYTGTGRILLGCRRRGDGAGLSIEIHDTGPGIEAGDLKRIFQEFEQVEMPGRDRGEGLGLGLAIVERLSRLLDHPVTVRSTPGRGSVFAVTVPRAVPVDLPRADPASLQTDAEPPTPPGSGSPPPAP